MFEEPQKIYYWDRRPGRFVNVHTGKELEGGMFTGNIQEWYESLISTIQLAKDESEGVDKLLGSDEACIMLEVSRLFLIPESNSFGVSHYEFGVPKGEVVGLPLFKCDDQYAYDKDGCPLIHVVGDNKYSTITLLGFKG